MNPQASSEIANSLFTRGTTLAILVMFGFVVFLGFSMFIDLRPAKAFVIDIPRWVKFALEKAWDFIKGVAKAFMLKFISNMVTKLVQKLEEVHVIRNFLQYSDALQFDKYIGSSLNKWIVQPLSKDEADQQSESLDKIGAEALKTAQLTGPQMEALAYLKAGSPATARIVFSAAKQTATAGESVALNWVISGQGLGSAYLCEDKVNLAGAQAVRPTQTTVYVLQARDAKNKIVDKKIVRIAVAGTQEKKCAEAGGGVLPGLSASQEKQMLKGGVALLTPQLACGGGFDASRVVQNVAIYQAAQARGFDPRKLSPSDPAFYQQMANYGNPMASREFRVLNMRDMANSIEAQASTAVNQELSSTGLKALRAERNNISRSGQTIADTIQQGIGQLFRNAGISSDVGFASSVGSFLADTVTNIIFKSKGTILTENPLCGLGLIAAGGIYGEGIDKGEIGSASITVNGSDSALVVTGETVTLAWNAEPPKDAEGKLVPGDVRITNLPAGCDNPPGFRGDCSFAAPAGQTTFEMQFLSKERTDTLGIATLSALNITVSFTAEPNPSPAPGSTVELKWNAGDPELQVKISGVGDGLPAYGTATVNKNRTTVYTLVIINHADGRQLSKKDLQVEVTGGVEGASNPGFLSPGFQVRE